MLYPQKPKDYITELEVVASIIECDWEVLLLQQAPHKNSPGKWLEPGWKLDVWETPEQAMIRETFEETWIQIKQWEAKLLFKKYFHYLEMNIAIEFYYICLDSKPQVTICNEHSNSIWVTPKDALKMDLVEDFDEILKEIYSL